MASLSILIPIAMLFCGIAIGLYLWAVRHDQFEDLDRESERILFDEDDDDFDKRP